MSQTPVRVSKAVAWLGGTIADAPKLQKSIYLSLTLSDLGSDSQGIRSVTVFTKKKVTNFLSKYRCADDRPAATACSVSCAPPSMACQVRDSCRAAQSPGRMPVSCRSRT